MKSINAADIEKYSGIRKYKIYCEQSVTSTNDVMKEWAVDGAQNYTVLAVEEQTHGRGRFDRSFYSPNNTGVYFSILLNFELDLKKSTQLTSAAAVAVALALDELCDVQSKIKWVNDIYIDDRKVCGILTEASYDSNTCSFEWAVVGIGINILCPKSGFPAEIKNRAGYVTENSDEDIGNKVIGRVLYYFDTILSESSDISIYEEYKKRSWLDGKRVEVMDVDTTYPATVVGIGQAISLIVETDDGEKKNLHSGEVTISFTD